jgi:hypothetical protein
MKIQVEVQVQRELVSYIHRTEVVIQILQWQEKIQPFGFYNFMEKGRRTQRQIYLYMKILGKINRSQMKKRKWLSLQSHLEIVHWIGL